MRGCAEETTYDSGGVAPRSLRADFFIGSVYLSNSATCSAIFGGLLDA